MLLATTRYGRKFHLISDLEFTICGHHQSRQTTIRKPDPEGACQNCVRTSQARLRKAGLATPNDVDILNGLRTEP